MKKLYLGIDIGGTKIRGVLWDGRRVLMAAEAATPHTRRAFVRCISSLIARLRRRAEGRIRGVGIGVAGRFLGTRVVRSRNIPYLRNLDVRALRLLIPIRMGNDAQAFARAETALGAGKRAQRMLAFTIGTGIGRAYTEEGRVRIIKRFERAEPWELDYQRIRDQGDTRMLTRYLAEKLSAIARRYQPDVIVLGGGVLERPRFFERLKAELRNRAIRRPIRRSRLGPNAAAIGAALLFVPELARGNKQ